MTPAEHAEFPRLEQRLANGTATIEEIRRYRDLGRQERGPLETCALCGGVGVRIVGHAGDRDSGAGEDIRDRCRECDGHGVRLRELQAVAP